MILSPVGGCGAQNSDLDLPPEAQMQILGPQRPLPQSRIQKVTLMPGLKTLCLLNLLKRNLPIYNLLVSRHLGPLSGKTGLLRRDLWGCED